MEDNNDSTSLCVRYALNRLNYEFNSQLQLRHMETGEPFKFIDQAHYEELADVVADYIQKVMIMDYGMIRLDLPLNTNLIDRHEKLKEEEENKIDVDVRCPIFLSPNAQIADVILILLCGSGRVASGQWARRLCINDSLNTGSVLPFLDWAKKHSMGVVVLNPNKNYAETREGLQRIPYNHSSEAHVAYAWEAVCKDLPAKHFMMVAHSYGGVSTCYLLQHHGEEVLERLRCIAFTDSVHSSISVENLPGKSQHFLAEHCINWASSQEPLDTVLEMPEATTNKRRQSSRKRRPKKIRDWFGGCGSICKVVSAGTDVHEETTMSAFPSICKFLLKSLQSVEAIVNFSTIEEGEGSINKENGDQNDNKENRQSAQIDDDFCE